MTYYQQHTGKPLVQNALVIPLQYLAFGNEHNIAILVKIEKDIGKGASKHVQQAVVLDFIGRIPLPEIASLKGKRIAIYRPREDFHIFFNDIIAIVKLGQLQTNEYNAKANIVKIRGHSLYINEDYEGTEQDYSRLLYEGYLNLKINPGQLVRILENALAAVAGVENAQKIAQEILERNDLINTHFMIADILPNSLLDGLAQIDDNKILENVYQMVYTIASYAKQGIYFRDLQPDNFRMNDHYNVKLIDPSYIDSSVPIESRYALFIKQTTPEYLPSVFSFFLRNNEQEKIMHYFGDFTAGVCIGMLERVIKRIFLPKYMGEKYDSLYLYNNPKMRIEKVIQLHFQEDMDFFHDMLQSFPTPEHFSEYQNTLLSYMRKEGVSYELSMKIPPLLAALRQFSYPVFTNNGCQSLLLDKLGVPVSIDTLSDYIADILQIKTSQPPASNFLTKESIDKEKTGIPQKTSLREKTVSIHKENLLDTTKVINPKLTKSWETKKYINPNFTPASFSTEVAAPITANLDVEIPVNIAFPYPTEQLQNFPDTNEQQETKKVFPKTGIFPASLKQSKGEGKTVPPTMIRPVTPAPFPSTIISEQEDNPKSRAFLPMPNPPGIANTGKDMYLPKKSDEKPGISSTVIRSANTNMPYIPKPAGQQDAFSKKTETIKPVSFPTMIRPSNIPPPLPVESPDLYLQEKQKVFPTRMRPAPNPPPVMETEQRVFKEGMMPNYATKSFIMPPIQEEREDRLPPNAVVIPPNAANLMQTDKHPALEKQVTTQRMRSLSDALEIPKKSDPVQQDAMPRYTSSRMMQKQETRRYEKNVRLLIEKIKTRLITIKSIMDENPFFEEPFRQRIIEILASGTTHQCIEDFLCNSDATIHSYEENFELQRHAQSIVLSNILTRLEYIAPADIKKHFQPNPTFAAKCKKIICRYLVRIVKTRFLLTADSMLDIFRMFPKPEEDLIEFICKHDYRNCFKSVHELPYAILRDIANITSSTK
ncbi:MAG: hypothetical protein HUU50_10605 [Candidatus Brocadiae bacterium]|nr:hypothetical protein [Candidatus Brocadiia bacterium]